VLFESPDILTVLLHSFRLQLNLSSEADGHPEDVESGVKSKSDVSQEISLGEDEVKHHSGGEIEIGEDENTCSICLVELENNTTICSIRKCNHSFHLKCVRSWLNRNLTCPICRENIITPSRLRDYMASNHKLLSRR
jgi:hypothetical protein